MHDILRNIVMIHCSKSKTFLFLLPTKKTIPPAVVAIFLGWLLVKGVMGVSKRVLGAILLRDEIG